MTGGLFFPVLGQTYWDWHGQNVFRVHFLPPCTLNSLLGTWSPLLSYYFVFLYWCAKVPSLAAAFASTAVNCTNLPQLPNSLYLLLPVRSAPSSAQH